MNCDGVAPPLYTGTDVGFSSLCVGKEITYDFVDDVIRELAALTPGKYLHIGGDEAHSTSHEDYVEFMDRVQPVVAKYGKTVVGWHQLTGATPAKGALAQYWGLDSTSAEEKAQVVKAAQSGTGLILSPADRGYLEMKYTQDTPLGLSWAGYVEVRRSYDWDPGAYLAGVPAGAVRGVRRRRCGRRPSRTPSTSSTWRFRGCRGLPSWGGRRRLLTTGQPCGSGGGWPAPSGGGHALRRRTGSYGYSSGGHELIARAEAQQRALLRLVDLTDGHEADGLVQRVHGLVALRRAPPRPAGCAGRRTARPSRR
ncbi:hypothetical protein SVIOM74S_09291 [Streptomyces violarus]